VSWFLSLCSALILARFLFLRFLWARFGDEFLFGRRILFLGGGDERRGLFWAGVGVLELILLRCGFILGALPLPSFKAACRMIFLHRHHSFILFEGKGFICVASSFGWG